MWTLREVPESTYQSSGGFEYSDWEGVGQIPGQQFIDPVDRMFGDASQDLTEISFRVHSVEFGCADQRIDGSGPLAAGVRPAEKVILAAQSYGAQRTFGRRVIDLQQSIVNVARERAPVRERIADRARSLAFRGELPQGFFHPTSYVVEQRLGARLTNFASYLGRLAANIFFDAVQSADASDGFGGNGRCMDYVNVVELAPGMSPTGDLVNVAAVVEMMKSRVGIGLQRALEVL